MRRAVHAEWTKVRTVAGPAWLLVALVVTTVGVSAITVASVRYQAGADQDVMKLALAGVDLGQAAVAGLAVVMVSTEYATGMIRTTLTALPHRLTMLASKAALLTTGVLLAGALAVGGSLVVARLVLPGRGFTVAHGYPVVSLGDATMLRAAVGAVLYLLLVGLLSLGIAFAVRDAAAATGIVLGLLYFFPLLAATVNDQTWHRHLEQIGPMTAGQAIESTTNLSSLSIGPWAGLGVLAAWAAGALLLGGALLRLRDA
jgi:ABC-2 type transport system permease protein